MKRRDLYLALASSVVAIWLSPSPARGTPPEIAVIVGRNSPAQKTTAAHLNAIFTTRMRDWDDGSPIRPLNFPPRHDLRVTFDRAVLGMGPDEVARFWIDRRVRGGQSPPRQVPSIKLMVGVVAKLRGAIGYVPADQTNDQVRVVARIRSGRVVDP